MPVYLLLMNDKLKTRIQEFWRGKLSDKGRRELLSKLASSEPQLKDDLKDEFGEMTDDEQLHRTEDYQDYLRAIYDKAGMNLTTKVRPMWHRWMAAASVLLVGAVLSWLWMQNNRVDENFNTNEFVSIAMQDTLFIHNTKDLPERHKLPDGSRLTLYPGSSIAYLPNYGTDNRFLTLTGEAKFEVAHDSSKPFVVTANGYSTTALGTSFIVDARNFNRLNVRLLTGKVVVKATLESIFPIEDQFLVPGEELGIDVDQFGLKKQSFEKQVQAPKKVITNPVQVDVTPPTSDLYFEDAPLSEVFNRIARIEKIQLDMSTVDVSELYFTGAFSEKDNLDQMLEIICAMNGLVYERTGTDTITVTAQP